MMEKSLQDLRYALRMLRVRPGFTAMAILSLALGIGANTAIFSVVNALLLKSLPYPDPDRLVLIWGVETDRGGSDRAQVSATDVADYRSQNSVFEDVTTYGNWSATFTGAGEPERVNGIQVGDGYFSIMKGTASLGRLFSPEEQIEGQDSVIVLGYALWQRKFAGDPNVIGRSTNLSGRPYTVVGVMPSSFSPLPTSLVDNGADFYRPVAEHYDDEDRSGRHLRAIGRLRQGTSLRQAQSEMTAIAARLEKDHPTTDANYGVRLTTITEDTVGGLRPSLLMLQGAVTFVLLIVCANVANMLLVRAASRAKEITIRSALGAARFRLVRQFLTESLLLSVTGGALGLLLAKGGIGFMESIGPRFSVPLADVGLDPLVLSFTGVVTVLTGVLFGLAPAVGASRFDLNSTLKEGGRGSAGQSGRTMKNVLVAVEFALALMLLAGGALMIKSVARLRGVDPGFNSDNLLTMNISLPSARYPQPAAQASFFKRLSEQVASLPAVESAGYVSVLPLGSNFDGRSIVLEDQPRPRGQEPSADLYVVTPGYLRAMKIRLLSGRMLADRDAENAPLSALVNETMAAEFWPGGDAIGKRIRFPGREGEAPPWRTVVGIVADVKQYGLDKASNTQFYLPEAQFPFQSGSLVVRGKTAAEALTSGVRAEVGALDKDLAIYDIATMNQLVSDSLALPSFTMVLLAIFALIALSLAAFGVYSVISYTAVQRTHEMGVRMALGAGRRDILRLIIVQGMLPAGAGACLGLIGGLTLTRLMSSLLFGVSPTDPLIFAGILAMLSGVAVLACYFPARRATETDPMTALRYE